MGMDHLQAKPFLACKRILSKMLDKSGHTRYVKLDECAVGEPTKTSNPEGLDNNKPGVIRRTAPPE